MNSKSVNRPVDTKQKERDIENKLRLYGIYKGFAAGKLPSNTQIDTALTSFYNHPRLSNPNKNLSAEGVTILQNFRNVVEEAKRLFLMKNYDQSLQEFIWNTTQLGVKGGPQTAAPGIPVSGDSASRDAQEVKTGLRTLGELIITNGQFRKLLNDAAILLRDVASDSTLKAATKVRPDEEALRQIDEPAPNNQWHDIPGLSRDSIREQFHEKLNKNKPLDRNDLREIQENVTAHADPHGICDPHISANRATQNQLYGTAGSADFASGVRAGIRDFRDRIPENIPEEHKQNVREHKERTVNFLSNKMPQERRDQVIFRLKKMVVEIQGHQDYQQAIDTLLRLAENYSRHGKKLAKDSTDTVQDAHQDSHLGYAEMHFRVIIERFANNTSADDLFNAINDIYRDADHDPELKEWFRAVNGYVRACLKEEGYIMRNESTERYEFLYDQGNFLLRDRYRQHTDRVANELKFMGEQFTADIDNKRFGDAIQKLFNDLGNDENGKPIFKKHLVKDITQVILPEILENIRYVPIPRIEYSDSVMDAVIENLVIESDNLMPNFLEIGNDNYLRFGRKSIPNSNKHNAMISASGIQCDLRDISYYINKKQGFPSLIDTGVADIFLGGEGFSFKLQLSTADKSDRARFFKVNKVNVSISNMTVKLKQSNHKLLFNLFKPLLLKIMKPALTKILEQQIRDTFGRLDALAWRIHQEQLKIEQDLRNNPKYENAQNIYNRYYQAMRREIIAKKEQAKAKTADKKVNMAVTKQDSMFKNISLPGGISTKATEYKEMAQRGERWQSDIFAIGCAPASTNIGEIAQVTRKSPYAHKATVYDRETSSTGGYSRDSGYHANDAYSSGLADKSAENQYDIVANHGARAYTLNKPLDGHVPMLSDPQTTKPM